MFYINRRTKHNWKSLIHEIQLVCVGMRKNGGFQNNEIIR